MNYTPNHHTPQWTESDQLRMKDFNQMSQDIEAGLDAARETAAEKPYVVGRYTGNGLSVRLNIGFKPSFIIISGMNVGTTVGSMEHMAHSAMTGGYRLTDRVLLVGETITISDTHDEQYPYPSLCEKGVTYDYIAFR